MDEIKNKLDELHELFKAHLPDICTSVNVQFTGSGWTFNQECRSPQSLKNEHISMKNIKGEWIK